MWPDILMPVFLGHLSHKRGCSLNGLIKIRTRRELFNKTLIRTIHLREIPHPTTRWHLGEHNHRNLRPAHDWHQFDQCLET
jgi:hypothetical protein